VRVNSVNESRRNIECATLFLGVRITFALLQQLALLWRHISREPVPAVQYISRRPPYIQRWKHGADTQSPAALRRLYGKWQWQRPSAHQWPGERTIRTAASRRKWGMDARRRRTVTITRRLVCRVYSSFTTTVTVYYSWKKHRHLCEHPVSRQMCVLHARSSSIKQ